MRGRGTKRKCEIVLDAGAHELEGTLEDEKDKVDLTGTLVGVLSARTEVESRSAVRVVAKDELFAGDGLGFDVLRRDGGVEPKVAPPFEGVFEALDALRHDVFRGAYVAQDALV